MAGLSPAKTVPCPAHNKKGPSYQFARTILVNVLTIIYAADPAVVCSRRLDQGLRNLGPSRTHEDAVSVGSASAVMEEDRLPAS